MPNIIQITDLAAPELDIYARLTQAQLRNRLEPEGGLYCGKPQGHLPCAGRRTASPVSFDGGAANHRSGPASTWNGVVRPRYTLPLGRSWNL